MVKSGKKAIALMLACAMILAVAPARLAAAEEIPGTVHVYAPTGDDPATPVIESPDVESVKYQVTANGTAVPAIRYNASGDNMDVARFASDDATPEFQITLKNAVTINTVTVYPERYYPQSALRVSEDRKTLTFTMSDQLRYALVMINGGPTDSSAKPFLALINDPPENALAVPKATDANVLNFKTFSDEYLAAHPITDTVGEKCTDAATIQDYSKNDDELMTWTHGDGFFVAYNASQVQFPNKRARQTNDVSEALQAALDKIRTDPALNTLYIPSGTYLWSGLRVVNWNGDAAAGGKPLTIYTEEGALLKNRLQECREALEPAIYIKGSSYITVSGRGIFDGQGVFTVSKDSKDARNSPHQGGSMVLHSNNIVFNDTYVRDVKQWNWECHTVTDVTYNNIKGLSPYNHSWVDGLDLTSGVNVTVNGAVTFGNDDCFASGHYNPSDEFPRRIFTENRTAEMTGNVMSAAYYYNGDRLTWDVADSENITVRNSLHYTLLANCIRTGHNTIGSNPGVNGSAGRRLKSYTFDNMNAISASGGQIRIQNGNLSSYPQYESVLIRNSSFWETATEWALIPTSTSGGIRIPDVVIENSWFNRADATAQFQNITNLTLRDIYLGGKLVKYRNQANITTLSGVTNLIFTAGGQEVRENKLPVFTSPAAANIDAYSSNPLAFTVAASDADEGDSVTIEAGALPSGAVFDGATGAFFWRPDDTLSGETYTVDFRAYDDGAREGAYAPAALSVKIHVLSSKESKTYTYVSEDAVLQTWNTEKNNNYGRGQVLKGLHPGNQGVLGTSFASTSTTNTTDIKLSLTKFDLTDLLKDYVDGAKVELALTYIGHRNNVGNGDMVSVGVFAVDSNAWAEGTGGVSGSAQTGPATSGVTWINKPAMAPAAEDVSWSDTFVAGSVVSTNAIQNYTGVIDGRVIRVDVSNFVKAAKDAGKTVLTLAFNTRESGKEIYFLSKDGIGRFTGTNNPALAPALGMTIESELKITGPDGMTLRERYAQSASGSFLLQGEHQPITVEASGCDNVSWNAGTHRLDILPGLKAGVYPVSLKATDALGGTAERLFTLTVEENTAPYVESFAVRPALAQGLAANLVVDIRGEHLGELTMRLDGKDYPVTAGEQRVYLAAAPAETGICPVALLAGDTLLTETTLEILPYSPDIWNPAVSLGPDGLNVQFAADISPKAGGYIATVNGASVACRQDGNALILESKPTGAAVIVIKGVKYARLFPSYSFTFTLNFAG